MVQSNQLTANIPNHSPSSIVTGQQDDYDYQDNREEELYQVDGTTDVQTPADNSDDNKDNEPDNNAHKRQKKTYAPADTVRKEMTKQRQAKVLKKQQEKERTKAQAEANKDKPNNANRPRSHKSKGKASHPDQIKRSKKGSRMARTHDENRSPDDTQSEDNLIGDEDIVPDDGEYPLGPDKIGFYTFFLEGQGNPPDHMGVDDDQLLAIQNDLQERLRARDKARERAVTRKLYELEIQIKEGNIKDATKETIELFEHTLDKKALIWFQQYNTEFKDLTTLKNMFLARYNPWGKQRDQLQLWNNLSFDPEKTNIDEEIDLVATLGNMLQQDEQVKMENFIETMPIIIQTHLIIEPNWAGVMKKAKNLEHIIWKCDLLAIAPPILQGAGAVPSLYSHIAQSHDQVSESILSHSKVQKAEEKRNQVKINKNLNSSLNHLPLPQNRKNIMKRQKTIIIMRIIEVIPEATDHSGVNKAVVENLIEVLNQGEGTAKQL